MFLTWTIGLVVGRMGRGPAEQAPACSRHLPREHKVGEEKWEKEVPELSLGT